MKKLVMLFLVLSTTLLFGQDMIKKKSAKKYNTNKQYFIGSSIFLLGNFSTEDSPNFFQLDYGYHLTPKDIIIAEAITWTYYEPLGEYGTSKKRYPGKIKSYGVGIGYQRFHWKELYSTLQATPFVQQFFDLNNKKIQEGFQLYLQLKIGYRFEFFNNNWFIEPAVVFNYWPINTNLPTSFKQIEDGSPNYFLFEPSLNFGMKF